MRDLFFVSMGGLMMLVQMHYAHAQKNLVQRSLVTPPQLNATDLSNIWGYTDGQGREYALVGTNYGTSIVEITNPDTPDVLFNIPASNNSIWREVATKGSYAYVGSDVNNPGPGLTIIDLSYLPDSIATKSWYGDSVMSGQISFIHTLRVSGDYLYLFGGSLNYPLFIDISDSWNPQYMGRYIYPGGGNAPYVHDGYARNDTLFSAHIYAGFFTMVDVTDKANPVLLGTQSTPGNFTHNMWLSDDSKTLFTTDEVDYSYLTSYDINDPSNIKELDRHQFNTSGSVVHNVHVTNDYCVNSWYKDGVVIVDCDRPGNLVTVGWFDTSPLSGTGMDGCWGVYPYFPSGTIVASDMGEGMYVLTPDYKRACYLEGTVTDSSCGSVIYNALVEILTSPVTGTYSDLSGEFALGTPDAGTFSVRISKTGYITEIITGLNFVNGNLINLNITLQSVGTYALNGSVTDSFSGLPLSGVAVRLQGPTDTYNFVSDNNGSFSLCNVVPGVYELASGAWGYLTYCNSINISSSVSISIPLQPGYYDDFSFDFGWTHSDTAASGAWEIGEPAGTVFIDDIDNDGDDDTLYSNPEFDVTGDCLDMAYVTGNAGGSASTDDIDNGVNVLTSPVFDLGNYSDPYLSYYRWFFNAGGFSATNDSLQVFLTNGTSTARLEYVLGDIANISQWIYKSYRINDYMTPTPTMQLIIKAGDYPQGHLVEAGFDNFFVYQVVGTGNELSNDARISFAPNPFSKSSALMIEGMDASTDMKFILYNIFGKEVRNIRFDIRNTGFRISRNELPSGIYFYRIESGREAVGTGKIIIE